MRQIDDNGKRVHRVTVWLSDDEAEQLASLSKKRDRTKSAMIRELIRGEYIF